MAAASAVPAGPSRPTRSAQAVPASPPPPASLRDYHASLSQHLASLLDAIPNPQALAKGCPPLSTPALKTRFSHLSTATNSTPSSEGKSEPTASTLSHSLSRDKDESTAATSPLVTLPELDSEAELKPGVDAETAVNTDFGPAVDDEQRDLTARPGLVSRLSQILSAAPPAQQPTAPVDPAQEYRLREEEHRRAWETDGKRVYKVVPPAFNLQLSDKKSRRGSNESSTRTDHGASASLLPMEGLPIPDLEAGLRAVNMVRQESEAPSGATMDFSSLRSPSPAPRSVTSSAAPMRSSEEGDDETYDRRREERLRRKEAALRRRVSSWWDGVSWEGEQPFGSVQPFPIIPPHIESPSLLAATLRSSLDTSLFAMQQSDVYLPLNPDRTLRHRLSQNLDQVRGLASSPTPPTATLEALGVSLPTKSGLHSRELKLGRGAKLRPLGADDSPALGASANTFTLKPRSSMEVLGSSNNGRSSAAFLPW